MTAREGLAWRGHIPDARGMPRKPYQPRRGNPYRAALWPRRTALRIIPGPSGSLGRGMAGRWVTRQNRSASLRRGSTRSAVARGAHAVRPFP
jgi:hypothetical protein